MSAGDFTATYLVNRSKVGLVLGVAIVGMAGCGGGGAGASEDGSYFAVQGLRAGSGAIYTACIDNIEMVDPKSTKGQAITASLVNYYQLSNWTAESGTGSSCKAKYPFANTTLTVDFYNTNVAGTPTPGSSGSGSSPSSTGGATTPTSSTTPTTSPSTSGTVTYVEWNGSVNGININDKNDEQFRAVSGSGQITNTSGVPLTGLTLVNGSKLAYNGAVIGYVGLASASNGGQLAEFYCANGTFLDINVANNAWTYSCGTGSTGGGGTGGTSPSPTGGASRSFITWTGSANGEVVLDATDERFRFYADTKCIYSDNTKSEYSNFCLSSSGNTVNFQGQTYSITTIRSTTGQCITGLITASGYFADIFGAAGGVQTISVSSKQPARC